jgi:tetratricopeptide (TPR) repeat protein
MHRNTLSIRTSLKVLFMIFTTLSAIGQNKVAEKFIHELEYIKTDSLQTNALLNWTDRDQGETGIYDSGTFYPYQIIAIGQKDKNKDVEALGHNLVGYYFHINDNNPQALSHFIKAMKLGEQHNNPRVMIRLYNCISFCDDDYANRIKKQKKVSMLAKKTKELDWEILATLQIGRFYLNLKQYDLALTYLQQAYQMNLRQKQIGIKAFDMDVQILTELGNTYNQLHNPTLALAYFHLALKAASKKTNHFWIPRKLMNVYQGLATYYKSIHNSDSTFYYSTMFYKFAEKSPQYSKKAAASQMLYEIYKERGNTASALKYHEFYKVATDSLNSITKTKKLESMLMQEKERQKELAEKREQENEEHKNNLQYAAIALGLVSFVILFLLFSHTIIANQKLIDSLGVIALLIVFEFLNLFLHPYLGELTHHSPILMLIAMVCIAAILVPLHHKIEHWTVHKLVEKNKRIRLAAAKKTIKQLETES